MRKNNTSNPDQEEEKPNFYAVIIAPVRYDKTLPAHAKLLYGEISALCNAKGYCWATNAYFLKHYDVNERTIQRWISALENAGYISVKMVTKIRRQITLKQYRPVVMM